MSVDLTPWKLYRAGMRNSDRLTRSLRRFNETGDIIELAPYLTAPRRSDEECDRIKQILFEMMDWEVSKWLYRPIGPPPWEKLKVIAETLCRAGLPLDEELFREIMGERTEVYPFEGGPGAEEWNP